MLPERQSPPAANRGASSVICDGDETSVAVATDNERCTRCGHPISARESLRIGLGRECRKAVEA